MISRIGVECRQRHTQKQATTRQNANLVSSKPPLCRESWARPTYPVRLMLPSGLTGTELRIWTGRPLTQQVSAVLTSPEWTGELQRGLYVAEVPKAGLRHGFQVSGAGPVQEVIAQTGPPVIEPGKSESFSLDVDAGNPAAAISVMDYRFDRIVCGTGELHEREMPGVYKVRVEFGRDITMISDEILLLDRDNLPGPVRPPQLPSPAPIPAAASTHEFDVAPFEETAFRGGRFTGPAAGLSAISVLARYPTQPGGAAASASGAASAPNPMQGIKLVDAAGRLVADLSQDCQINRATEAELLAVWEQELPPGNYFLRQVFPNGRQYEGCVIASPNWVTQIAVERAAQVGGAVDQSNAMGDAAVFMRRPGTSCAPDQDAVIEGARVALTQDRNLLAEGRGIQLAELLTECTDPIAGIIGGHLLLRAMDEAKADPVRARQIDSLVTNLRSLVGPDHPDVEALSLRCSDVALAATGPFTAPPMFRHGWQLVAQASYQRPELIPMELWQRVHASVPFGTFFVWAADEQRRRAHEDQLCRWISQYSASGEAQATPTRRFSYTRRPRLRRLQRTVRNLAASSMTALPRHGPLKYDIRGAVAASSGRTFRQWRGPEPPAKATRLPEAARDAAYRMQVPAVAAAALWDSAAGATQKGAAAG